jgi:hypothetical protein
MGTIAKIIKYRKEILEGAFNLAVKDEFVESVSEYRINICKGCKYFDGNCAVPGTGPCCGACGCSLAVKTRSLSTVCGAIQKNEDPKWLPVISREDEQNMLAKTQELLEKQNNIKPTE